MSSITLEPYFNPGFEQVRTKKEKEEKHILSTGTHLAHLLRLPSPFNMSFNKGQNVHPFSANVTSSAHNTRMALSESSAAPHPPQFTPLSRSFHLCTPHIQSRFEAASCRCMRPQCPVCPRYSNPQINQQLLWARLLRSRKCRQFLPYRRCQRNASARASPPRSCSEIPFHCRPDTSPQTYSVRHIHSRAWSRTWFPIVPSLSS